MAEAHGHPPIDVHTHVVPDRLPPYAGKHADAPWPSIRKVDACHAHVMIGGKVFREIDDACWSDARRIEQMQPMGIGLQVLSPMPELLSTWMAPEDGAALARFVNERIAETVQRQPQRFAGLGMVPLQHVDAAIAELERAVGALGLRGVEIGTNVEGVPIGAPRFEPFFAAAADLGAAIFIHPLRPVGMERLVGPPILEQGIGFPCETAFALASLVTGGTLQRHPALRIAVSHGGGAFGQVLPRLQHMWSLAPALREGRAAPAELARWLFYDTLVYSPLALRYIADLFGIGQLVLGTDYPFLIMEKEPVARLDALGLSPEQRSMVLAGNARRFLGM